MLAQRKTSERDRERERERSVLYLVRRTYALYTCFLDEVTTEVYLKWGVHWCVAILTELGGPSSHPTGEWPIGCPLQLPLSFRLSSWPFTDPTLLSSSSFSNAYMFLNSKHTPFNIYTCNVVCWPPPPPLPFSLFSRIFLVQMFRHKQWGAWTFSPKTQVIIIIIIIIW